jgi:hypothetical protein
VMLHEDRVAQRHELLGVQVGHRPRGGSVAGEPARPAPRSPPRVGRGGVRRRDRPDPGAGSARAGGGAARSSRPVAPPDGGPGRPCPDGAREERAAAGGFPTMGRCRPRPDCALQHTSTTASRR